MGTYVDQAKGNGELLADVPVDTFRSHIRFIEKHNLWDEVRGALAEAGVDTVAMDIRPVRVISELVAAKGMPFRKRPITRARWSPLNAGATRSAVVLP